MYHFVRSIPINKSKARRAIISMTTVIVICAVGVILSEIYWDKYTHEEYSLRLGRNVTRGWPANVFSWGSFIGGGFIILMPLMYFMQDWKNPSLGILQEGLFINQQMIRNCIVPYSDISSVEKKESGYFIHFKENQLVYSKAGIFKVLVKNNLKEAGLCIDDEFSPELDLFFDELSKRIAKTTV